MAIIYTPDQVMRRGLLMVGVNDMQQQKQLRKTNIEDFKAHFGVLPVVLASIWEELVTTPIVEARIDPDAMYNRKSVSLKNFLQANHFLMRYATETERKVQLRESKKTLRKWCLFVCLLTVSSVQVLVDRRLPNPDRGTVPPRPAYID